MVVVGVRGVDRDKPEVNTPLVSLPMARPAKQKNSSQARVLCQCKCGRRVSLSTQRRHLAGRAAPHVLAASLASQLDNLSSSLPEVDGDVDSIAGESQADANDRHMVLSDGGEAEKFDDMVLDEDPKMNAPLDCPRPFGSDDSAPAIEDHPQVPRFHPRTTVEDYESDSEESHASSDAYDWDADLGDLYDAPPEELSDEDILPGEAIDGAFERQLAEFAEELTDGDCDASAICFQSRARDL
ncbi:hypothetical protein HGRIS_009830 [Hohenbuehelia grisea]|uniref:Uncharacterized protein n=1 Tax=Hohenbuehelia grisea TaxID=104357 RepID=A0ABR3J2C0_9AGAR